MSSAAQSHTTSQPGRIALRLARSLVSRLWGVGLLLGIWELWIVTATPNSLVVVPPGAVLHALLSDPGGYAQAALWTTGFALSGLIAGFVVGLTLAIAAWRSPVLAGLASPAALLLSSTPVVCLIPLVARIFGYRPPTEFVTVSMMMFFPSFVFASAGLRNLPHLAGPLAETWNTPPRRRLWLLALPAALPSLAIALRSGAAASILVTLVAEYLMQTGGLGALFATTMQQFDIARALGASLIAMVLASTLYAIAGSIEQRVRARFT